jgi:hypothetical protein
VGIIVAEDPQKSDFGSNYFEGETSACVNCAMQDSRKTISAHGAIF